MRWLNRLCGIVHFGVKNIDVEPTETTCIRQSGFVSFIVFCSMQAILFFPVLHINVKINSGLWLLGWPVLWFTKLCLVINVSNIKMSTNQTQLRHENIFNDFLKLNLTNFKLKYEPHIPYSAWTWCHYTTLATRWRECADYHKGRAIPMESNFISLNQNLIDTNSYINKRLA